VEEGKISLGQKRFDEATEKFQEAVNIDPRNGEAFYYLALVKYEKGEYDQVMNFLTKAEALLKNDSKWASEIGRLRKEVQGGGDASLPEP
jgi:tetratricopeptide (TPR) repeat protein